MEAQDCKSSFRPRHFDSQQLLYCRAVPGSIFRQGLSGPPCSPGGCLAYSCEIRGCLNPVCIRPVSIEVLGGTFWTSCAGSWLQPGPAVWGGQGIGKAPPHPPAALTTLPELPAPPHSPQGTACLAQSFPPTWAALLAVTLLKGSQLGGEVLACRNSLPQPHFSCEAP